MASSSAWVKVCVAVQLVVAPGASVSVRQTASSLSLSSDRLIPVSVRLPVFVTR